MDAPAWIGFEDPSIPVQCTPAALCADVSASVAVADQAVMRLAASNGVLFGRHAALLSLSRPSAQNARSRLLERGQIVESDRGVAVVDPLYVDWISNRFPI